MTRSACTEPPPGCRRTHQLLRRSPTSSHAPGAGETVNDTLARADIEHAEKGHRVPQFDSFRPRRNQHVLDLGDGQIQHRPPALNMSTGGGPGPAIEPSPSSREHRVIELRRDEAMQRVCIHSAGPERGPGRLSAAPCCRCSAARRRAASCSRCHAASFARGLAGSSRLSS